MEINKYYNSKIYKIFDLNQNMVYYGSTINRLCQRMSNHLVNYRTNKKCCSVKKIFDEYGVENCKIELVENYPCNSRTELEAREGYYIKNNECINKNIVGRSFKESIKAYNEANKDIINLKNRIRYQSNKKKFKEYYEVNKEKIKTQQKEYNEANKEKIRAYKKAYYEKNKDKNKLSQKN